jgi:hypothetical protein
LEEFRVSLAHSRKHLKIQYVSVRTLGSLVLQLPTTYVKLSLQSFLVRLIDVGSRVILLVDNNDALTRTTWSD